MKIKQVTTCRGTMFETYRLGDPDFAKKYIVGFGHSSHFDINIFWSDNSETKINGRFVYSIEWMEGE